MRNVGSVLMGKAECWVRDSLAVFPVLGFASYSGAGVPAWHVFTDVCFGPIQNHFIEVVCHGQGEICQNVYIFSFPLEGHCGLFLFVRFVCVFFFFHNIFQVQQGLVPEKHAALKHFREHGIYMPPWSYSKEWSQAARLVLQACAFWTMAIPQPIWGTMERLHPGEHLDWRVFT